MSDLDFEAIYDSRFLSTMKALGVDEPAEVLLYAPADYIDLSEKTPNLIEALRKGKEGERSLIQLKLRGPVELMDGNGNPISPLAASRVGGTHRAKVKFTDGKNIGMCMLFGRAGGGNLDPWCELDPSSPFFVYGLVNDDWNGVLSFTAPEIVSETDVGKIIPRYMGKERVVTPKRISSKIKGGLLNARKETQEFILRKLNTTESSLTAMNGFGFGSLDEFILTLHRPKSKEDVVKAINSTKTLNAMYAYAQSQEHKEIGDNPESNLNINVKAILPELVSRLPFKLTEDQRFAAWDVLKDLNSDKPMRRLLSGDVGTGKTICYVLPAVAAQKSGKNVVIMTPNSLLTNQISKEIQTLFPEIPVVTMVGGAKEEYKVEDGTVIVGTTAILWWLEKNNYQHRIDFYVLDEQQKLGKEQKERLMQNHTNFLEATATAIPRTMALIKYSDMKVSRIMKCPVEKIIHSHIIGADSKMEAFDKIQETVASGGQAAILYPRRDREISIYEYKIEAANGYEEFYEAVEYFMETEDDIMVDFDPVTSIFTFECNNPAHGRIKKHLNKIEGLSIKLVSEVAPEDDDSYRRSVEEAYKRWQKTFGDRVAMLHGKTSPAEKVDILDRIKRKEIDVLITSTVIEIGLTIPSLSFVMVVGADKMGASTLHQIRGRLVRNGGEGDFYMYVDKPFEKISEKSMERLENVKENLNGFDIAANDMEQRGFGDIGQLGRKQSGFSKGLFPGTKTSPKDIDELLEGNTP